MPALFKKTTINGMELNNRFVRSATWEGMTAEDGTCTQRPAELIGELAQRGVGLIISGHAYIRKDGQSVLNPAMLEKESIAWSKRN
jgi:2,4-dienoyl-CoA reductase-like NADH-dependent reductase (Old Yellow Enzyme family)